MEVKEYFESLNRGYESANGVATTARSLGFDPERFVEIRAAPDVASRVEGILDVEGLAEMIRA